MNVTLIGTGNIGSAMVKGWCKKAEQGEANIGSEQLCITVAERDEKKLEALKASHPMLNISTDNKTATEGADIIIIAVKPWQVEGLINEIRPNLKSDTIFVSVAAGITSEKMGAMLAGGDMPQTFLVIPNIAAEFGASMTFISPLPGTKQEAIDKVEALFKLDGGAIVCEEKLLVPGMLMASCGIAYVMRMLRAQAQAGVEMGFYPKDALDIAMQTMQGAVSLLRGTGEHPEVAIDRVTTPGGYTIKGLNELDHSGVASGIIKAFKTGL